MRLQTNDANNCIFLPGFMVKTIFNPCNHLVTSANLELDQHFLVFFDLNKNVLPVIVSVILPVIVPVIVPWIDFFP